MSEPADGARGKKKRELHKLAVARSDITAALHAAQLIVKRVDGLGDDLYMPLFHAAAIAYGRPFTNNKPYGSLGKKWGRFGEPRLQKAHDSLNECRDKLVAHSDQSRRPVFISPPGTPVAEGMVMGNVGLVVETTVFAVEVFRDVADTCLDLGGRLNDAVEQLLRDLFGGRTFPPKAFPLTFDDD